MQSPYKYADELSFPHMNKGVTTNAIMRDVLLALIPSAGAGIYYFGFPAFILMATAVAVCVITEYIWQRIFHIKVTVGDYSAAVTGLLLAMNIPATAPVLIIIPAGLFAIIIGKQVFGGIGNNFINPALTGRLLLMRLWPGYISGFASPNSMEYGALNSATVLYMGETCKLLLMAGFLYLIFRKRVSLQAPVSYLITVLLVVWLFAQNNFITSMGLKSGTQLFGGGLLLGAFFMVTDYSSVSTRGKIYFGIIAGLVTGAIRVWGNYPEGVYIGILVANCMAPLIEKLTKRHVYGTERIFLRKAKIE